MKINWPSGALLGLDIGSRTIKGIRLTKKKNRISLDSYFFHDLAEVSGEYPERADAVETLRAGVELQKLGRARVAACVPDRDVIHVALNLPELKPAEMRAAVCHEVAEHTGISETELAFDYDLKASPKGGTVQVAAYGVRLGVIQELARAANVASLRPTVAEPQALAVRAMLEFNGYLDKDQTYAVFDLGESGVTASLITDNDVRLSRATDIGVGRINRALMEKLNISYAAAEGHKRHYDFNSSDRGEQEAERIIDDAYAEIFSGVKQTLELFRENLPEASKIDQILLLGGGSQTRNMERVFELFFKISAVVVNPFRNVEIFDQPHLTAGDSMPDIVTLASQMGPAVGAAVRTFMKESA